MTRFFTNTKTPNRPNHSCPNCDAALSLNTCYYETIDKHMYCNKQCSVNKRSRDYVNLTKDQSAVTLNFGYTR